MAEEAEITTLGDVLDTRREDFAPLVQAGLMSTLVRNTTLLSFMAEGSRLRVKLEARAKEAGHEDVWDAFIDDCSRFFSELQRERAGGAVVAPLVAGLSRLALRDGQRVRLKIKDFNQIPKGPSAFVDCATGEDFFEAAKAEVGRVFSVSDGLELHFCCYVRGGAHRFEFTGAAGYWDITPDSPIYFWTEPRPESPDKDREHMRRQLAAVAEEQAAMKRTILRLQASSSSAQVQAERWANAERLALEEVERCFSVTCDVIWEKVTQVRQKGGPKQGEKGVQQLWNELLGVESSHGVLTLSGDSVVKDCRKPGGIAYGGRSHDIDLVLLVRNVLAMEYVDIPIELKAWIDTEASRREVVLQLLDRMSFVFDAQPAREVCWGVGLDASNVLFVRCERTLS